MLSPPAPGTFLARRPAPMSLGAAALDDGTEVVGFSCAPYGVEAATALPVEHWLDRNGIGACL